MQIRIIAAMLAIAPQLASAQTVGDAWREDVRTIARELPARHPNAFYRLDRAAWDSAVSAATARIPSLTRTQAVVALMELVALVRDGHTTINPWFDRAGTLHYYPVQFHQFEDGLFIRAATPEHAALVGSKVLRVGRVSAAEAVAAIGRVIPHENEHWVNAWAPTWMVLAELLDGLGITESAERLTLVVEKAGRQQTITLTPGGTVQPPNDHNPNPIDRSSWVSMQGSGGAPLWLRNPGRPYWSEYSRADSTLYVSYRAVMSLPQPNSSPEFWRSVFALADSVPVRRFVLDIRENVGGNSFFNRQVVRGIVARPEMDRPDRLFVITGSRTFSAAMNLARDLEKWTNATFVGEPTGNAAVFFGDHEQVALPASGLTLNVSTLSWPPYDPRDRRDFLAPAIYAPLTSTDFRSNIDPAMRAIMTRTTTPPVAERMAQALARGDTLSAARIAREAAGDVANRYRTPEADINALGYRLLNAGQAAQAVVAFRINTQIFPNSANVWDSYGEALAAAGKKEEAIASYQRALALNPQFASSRDALERLRAREQ